MVIADHVGDAPKKQQHHRALVSKSLYPFLRPTLWRNIDISNGDDFIAFIRDVNRTPDIAKSIRSLTVKAWWMTVEEYPANRKQLIYSFFRSLTSLSRLELDDHPLLYRLLLSPRFARSCFGSLETFALAMPPHFAFRSDWLTNLALMGRVKHVELRTQRSSQSARRWGVQMVEAQEVDVNLGTTESKGGLVLSSLSVSGPVDSEDLRRFVSTTVVKTFALEHGGIQSNSVINTLASSSRGSLDGLRILGFPESAAVTPSITSFHNLTSLAIPSSVLTLSLFSALYNLPKLESLELLQIPSSEHLYSILAGPQRLSTLTSLLCRAPVSCQPRLDRPDTIDIENWWNRETGIQSYDSVLGRPVWDQEFTLEQAREIVLLAKQGGVELSGDLAAAIKISEEFVAPDWFEDDDDEEEGRESDEYSSDGYIE